MSDKPAPSRYHRWKLGIPFLYDWFANHNLTWPSLSCRWGPDIVDSKFTRKQYVYLSERTDLSEPNKLTMVPVELYKPRVAAAEAISGFHEKAKSLLVKSPHCTILHPGEVNKIREVPENPNIVATHSDVPSVYVWHFGRQPDRASDKSSWSKLSEPDLLLTGHKDTAEFALATTSASPMVASGGRDAMVLLWNLRDYDGGSLLAAQRPAGAASKSPKLASSTFLKGHKNTVGDVVFQPRSAHELGSVADDRALLFWDTRHGTGPAGSVANAHGQAELRCIDWSARDTNAIATGAEDGSLRVWDRRNLAACVHTFSTHSSSLTRVEWSSYRPGLIASGGEDGVLCLWDLQRTTVSAPIEGSQDSAKLRASLPTQLMFQHAGHQAGQIADFQWHPRDPFTLVSVSDDPEGGTLQMWRVNDLIYRPENEVLAELERFRDDILIKERQTAGRRTDAEYTGTPEPPPRPDTAPPLSTGAGSAPATTPAGAFVGVPEGVPVAAAEERERDSDPMES